MTQSNDIISRLNLSSGRLSKGHRKIAQFIEEQYDKAAFMTAARLGRLVSVSESTVVRFANALGYEGYPQMQKALQEIVHHRLTSSQRLAMSASVDASDLPDVVLRTDLNNIRATIDEIDREAFAAVVDAIASARTIYVLGLRSAAPLAQFLSHYLQFIFDDVRLFNGMGGDVFEAIARISPRDALVAISFPRYSSRTLESMGFARSRGGKVIGITDGPLSPLHEVSDLCLDARTDMVSFVDSLAAPLSLINALLVALGVRNAEKLTHNLRNMEQIWDTYRIYDAKQ
ncbi:MAG: MurR/RpiR family transcriptional regulator [Clostridiales bacterium]|nr:MurR/RpiR family transcriptional regulator [Clostridiales bacterium]